VSSVRLNSQICLVVGFFAVSSLIFQSEIAGFSFAHAAPSGPSKSDKILNHYIVVLEEDASPKIVAEQARNNGASILQTYDHALKGFAMKVPNDRVLKQVEEDERVEYVEPDHIVTTFAQILPSGIDRADADQSVTVKAGDGSGLTDVDIAIIDTGINLSHPDLYVFKNKSFVPGAKTGNDDNGHGSHVAGIAAARDNGNGVVGMAPGARLWAVKVLDRSGSGSLSNVIKGIDFVTANYGEIDVVNMSLGCECISPSMTEAITNSVKQGITYVVAAGNSAKDASTFSPANHPDVITVSAIVDTDGKGGHLGPTTSYGDDDTFASFSNYGSTVDMAAPGVKIYSTYKNGGYATMSGTSMASPHVAGAAAIYKAANPGATPAQVESALQTLGITSGVDYFTADPDSSNEPLVSAKNL